MLDDPDLSGGLFTHHRLPHGRGHDGKHIYYAVLGSQTAAGTVIIAPGRGEHIERYAKTCRDLVAHGFRIIIFDWRGQGSSERFLDGDKRQRSHVPDFDILLKDFRHFYETVVKFHQTGPLVVLGNSKGAHLLARWMAEQPVEKLRANVKGFIFSSPMTGFTTRPLPRLMMEWAANKLGFETRNGPERRIDFPWYAGLISRAAVAAGLGESYALGERDYDPNETFEENRLTHDRDHFESMKRQFEIYPHLKIGGVTWDWVEAARRSLQRAREKGYVERLQIPGLVLIGEKDPLTPRHLILPFTQRLPTAEIVNIAGAKHGILEEAPAIRGKAMKHIGAFLARVTAG